MFLTVVRTTSCGLKAMPQGMFHHGMERQNAPTKRDKNHQLPSGYVKIAIENGHRNS